METILHIGMPKTGTTSLQRSLANERALLRERGVLYPRLTQLGHAHHLLSPLVADPSQLWGRVRSALGDDPLAAARAHWEHVLRQVEEQRPAHMVLSTEAWFDRFPPEGLARWAQLVRAVSSRVRIVAYVREPAKYYASILMERAKRTSRPRPMGPIAYRAPIEEMQRALGAEVTVRLFERSRLHDGDITRDFTREILGFDLPQGPAVEGNVSMTPEAAALFIRIMRRRTGARSWGTGGADRALADAFVRIGREVGARATPLRPEVAEAVTYASTDLLWLRDEFGLAFDGIDYARLAERRGGPTAEVKQLQDAFELDPGVTQAILRRVEAEFPDLRAALV